MTLKFEGGIFPKTVVQCYNKCTFGFGAKCCGDFGLLVSFFGPIGRMSPGNTNFYLRE